eukprot:5370513-Prymnesium_polylepis.1
MHGSTETGDRSLQLVTGASMLTMSLCSHGRRRAASPGVVTGCAAAYSCTAYYGGTSAAL